MANEEIGGVVADLLRIISGDQAPKISNPRTGWRKALRRRDP